MTAALVHLGEDVEQEWLHIKVESFVVEKQFCHETEILTVHLVITTVHLKHRYRTLETHFSGGGKQGPFEIFELK